MKRIFIVFLCFCIILPSAANASSKSFQHIDIKEKELTKEILLEMEEKMKTMSPKDAAAFFEETMKKHTYDYVKYPYYSDKATNDMGIMANVGDTRSSIAYSNSGLFSASSTKGIWINIINSSISLVLGLSTFVGSILYGVANLFVAVTPDTSEQAEAKNYLKIINLCQTTGYLWLTPIRERYMNMVGDILLIPKGLHISQQLTSRIQRPHNGHHIQVIQK
ncbi:hypothetical protein FE784_33250 [Paenibacillus hemerocallicola]|uniref:Uncharacterized protein n=1 Tax=Paenibacillus hemerocallicola TaxID=1172614 RepID=A0A5C4T1A9_9BACL|nr:hypothetical protein [Paenibacillus hemerocallicola]TNJ61929.1 hypothetical protein FE784_33250 [Paenibacillus hemerocallicola]